jgi:hypothetical protein
MHAKEHASMTHETSSLFSPSTPPSPFTPDWHHQFGAKLCAFPRYLVAPFENVNLQFWPDLATFAEGPCWSVMMYYPGASRASICVLHWKDVPRWEAIAFDDEDIIAKLTAGSFQGLMEDLSSLVLR